MKFRYFLTSILACLALIGCVQEELPGLSDIKVTPSYFTLGVDGGSKEVAVTTSSDWTVTDIPEWVTVNPSSGKGNGKFTVSAIASTDTLARAAFLKVNAGSETQIVTVNQDAFVPDFPEFKGGDYWIVFDGGAAIPVAGASYGWLYTAPTTTSEDGKITSTAQNIFTFTAVEGGFTIQDPAGQFYYMTGTYNSFNVTNTMPETGAVWTVKQTSSITYDVVNTSNGKVMQFDSEYSSAGAYSDGGRIYPNLVKVEVIPEPEPLGDATDIKDAAAIEPEVIVEGLVSASSTKGVVVTDKTGSLLVYGINAEVEVGDSLKVKGNLSSYNKGYQLVDPYQYEIASSDNAIIYPEATKLTPESVANIVKPALFLAEYVSLQGIASVDSYKNAIVNIGDYKVKTYYSHDDYSSYAEKAVEIKGYVVSFKESANEINIIVTSIEELEDWVPEVEGESIPFEEAFADGFGAFTTIGDDVWSASSYGDDTFMKASGYIGGEKTDSESMLVSPVIDLTSESSAFLSFDHTGKFFGTMTDETTVWAKKYGEKEWVELTIPTYMSGSDYKFVNSGDIDLKDFLGSKMQFAFKYISTSAAAGTWEVTNVKVLKDSAASDDNEETSAGDVLTFESTGLATTTQKGYQDWTYTAASGAVYAGQSNGGYDDVTYIQLRSKNNNSGVVTTTSAGKVAKVILTWNTKTTVGRTVYVYGNSSAYAVPADLFDEAKQGTKLGDLVYAEGQTVTELTIEGDAPYIGIRSADGALYLDKIEVVWAE